MTCLGIHRRWKGAFELAVLSSAVRSSFCYLPGDDRATGYVYVDGEQDWVSSLSEYGPVLLAELHDLLGVRFTHVAFQAYRNGSAMTGFHADTPFDEQAILSFGATRTLAIADYDQCYTELTALGGGDLVFMASGFQDRWLHSIPAEPHVTGERCSLVFRTVKGASCTR